MDERQLNKTIGYGILLIIGYHIIGAFMPVLMYGVMAMIVLRVIQEYQKHKK